MLLIDAANSLGTRIVHDWDMLESLDFAMLSNAVRFLPYNQSTTVLQL
jgi:hypothetical protein